MKKLSGTAKQIAWANKIREKAADDLNRLINRNMELMQELSLDPIALKQNALFNVFIRRELVYKAALDMCGQISESAIFFGLEMKRRKKSHENLSTELWETWLWEQAEHGKITKAEYNRTVCETYNDSDGITIDVLPESVSKLLKKYK